jgi:prophage tail gpP-like protein
VSLRTGRKIDGMLHPKYEIEIGQASFEPGTSNENNSLSVSKSMNFPSDIFEGTFRNDGRAATVKSGDTLKLSLGYEDGMSEVFQGHVQSLNLRMFDMGITAYSATFKLSRLRKDKFYEQRTAGQIVKDLADIAQVEVQDLEEGVKFPYYAIDSNKSLYEHIKELALVCGFDSYCDSKNKLVFKKYNPKTKHTVEYGKSLISLALEETPSRYQGVKVIGESPSSESGSETSHWLKKEQIQSSAGSQEFPMIIINRAVKDEETAKRIAEESLNTIKSQLVVVMDLVGSPEVMLGDAVIIERFPNKTLNGEYKVRTVQHYFSKKNGFVSTLRCRGESKE